MTKNQILKNEYILALFLILLCTSELFSQENIVFKRHRWKNNTLAGHHWQWEFPIDCRFRVGKTTSDFDYDTEDQALPYIFGAGFKYALRNEMDRGIALGASIDYTTNKYFRYNLLIDLDFLFHFALTDEKHKIFGESVFANYALSTIVTEVNGRNIPEFYLSINFIQIHIYNFTLSFNLNKGIFRNKYPPVLAQQGMYYNVSYTFLKK